MKPKLALCLAAALAPLPAAALELSSPDIPPGGKIADAFVYSGYGCAGGNVSPSLRWSDPPAGTQSFALMVLDVDAPAPGGYWHWSIFDIPVRTSELLQGAGDPRGGKPPAAAIEGRNSFGAAGYAGPCPPQGKPAHHYHFMLFAVDAPALGLDATAKPDTVRAQLKGHTLAKAEFVATYGR